LPLPLPHGFYGERTTFADIKLMYQVLFENDLNTARERTKTELVSAKEKNDWMSE